MSAWLGWPIAGTSIAICLFLWFRDVRRIMMSHKSTVESAASQLAACREKAIKARGDPDTAAVLERSEKIYQQALDIYNQTLKKAWVYPPAILMGFHTLPPNEK